MKRILAVVFVLFLFGCSTAEYTEPAIELRQRLLSGRNCLFDCIVTADYGDKLYTFSMKCEADQNGKVSFIVSEPDTIRGISGNMSAQGGAITFDDQVLAFPMLADGQVAPIGAPFLLIKTLRSGYIRSCGKDDRFWKIQIDDSYEEKSLQLDIWLDEHLAPIRCDILYAGRRYLVVDIENFVIQ